MDSSAALTKTEEEDAEMAEKDVKVKAEKNESDEKPNVHRSEDDDDDVIVMPQEAPVVHQISDETEVSEENAEKETEQDTTLVDDDVLIQEPKIETQLVLDDDEEDRNQQKTSPSAAIAQPFIVKIKEEPKDDGYEDLVNEEDAFIEVTAIASEDLKQGKHQLNALEHPNLKLETSSFNKS